MKKGFTLIEVLIVSVITVILTALVISNFSRVRSRVPQLVAGAVGDIRVAQNRSVSGTLLDGTHHCGYGIKFEADRYFVYAGPQAGIDDCSSDTHDYVDNVTTPIVLEIVLPPELIFSAVGDFYFEPPQPVTHYNGTPATSEHTITLQEPSAQCPSPGCKHIIINASGAIRQR